MSANPQRRKASHVPGAKLLISASALAATLIGWASLAWKSAADAGAVAPSVSSVEAQLAAAGVVLQPIPTLAAGPNQDLAVAPADPQPSSPQPVLRSVSAPPAPVTVTRSSRR
jgi:hypothetical protein